MCPRSLCALRHFTRVYLRAQTAVHMHLRNHVIFFAAKTRITPIGAPCQDKDGDLWFWDFWFIFVEWTQLKGFNSKF